jgi:hypothetical protein
LALREIAAHFGFDFDKSKLNDADKSIEKVKGHAEESVSGVEHLVSAFGALAGLELVRMTRDWVVELANAGDELADNAEATGLSTRQLQVWQLGAAQAGEDAVTFTNALRVLSKAVAGGKDDAGTQAATFKAMGIETKNSAKEIRPLGDILPEIAEHFHNMADGAAKSTLAQELFGKSGTKLIPLLNQGAGGVEKLSKEFDRLGGGFDEEAIERAGEMKVAIANVNQVFTSLKSQLAIALLPRFATLLGYLESGVGFMTQLARDTTLAESAVGSLSTALALTLGAALLPYIGGALKFAAIYLAVDDLKAFLEGNTSAIGQILDSWFGDGTAVVVRAWCLDAFTSLANAVDDMRAVLPLFVADVGAMANDVKAVWDTMCLGLATAWNKFIGPVQAVLGAIGSIMPLPPALKVLASIPTDALTVDTTKRAQDAQDDNTRKPQFQAYRDRKASAFADYVRNATPTTASDVTQQIAPFRTAMTQNATPSNWVQTINAPITINVPAGTPQAQTEAIGRQTRQASRDAHRQALQALENRGGS